MSQPVKQRKAKFYKTSEGNQPYIEWFNNLKDVKTKATITKRVGRAEKGLFGDCDPVGEGVQELRIDYGPGFRIYIGVDENNLLIILLIGGSKKGQQTDIDNAKSYWADYKKQKKEFKNGKKK